MEPSQQRDLPRVDSAYITERQQGHIMHFTATYFED